MNFNATRDFAKKTTTPEFFLDDPNPLIRESLLTNPNITEQILNELIDDPSINIREKLAKKFLYKASRDTNFRVRYAVLKDNPEVPENILKLLVCDEDVRIRKKARELLKINKDYVYRKNFDGEITIKLVIPSKFNAVLKQNFLDNFLLSLEQIMLSIDNKQDVLLEIVGDDPLIDPEFFIKVLHKLRDFCSIYKFNSISCTTNGIFLKKVAPFMRGVINQVNILINNYNQAIRSEEILETYSLPDNDYREIVRILLDNDIYASATAMIDKKFYNFKKFRDKFIKWCNDIGFVSLKFINNVYKSKSENIFLKYMQDSLKDDKLFLIQKENTTILKSCQLSTKDGFLVFFLKDVLDTYEVSPGLEFFVHDDAKAYADFKKKVPLENYTFPIGYVFDNKKFIE